jgi:PqqD family protein of HPr-rel-A system
VRYRAGPRGDYIVRPVDDLTIVYHRPAGMTHVVAPVVAAILETLHDRALDVDGVVSALRAAHRFDDEVHAIVAARLDEMVSIDLVDRLA